MQRLQKKKTCNLIPFFAKFSQNMIFLRSPPSVQKKRKVCKAPDAGQLRARDSPFLSVDLKGHASARTHLGKIDDSTHTSNWRSW